MGTGECTAGKRSSINIGLSQEEVQCLKHSQRVQESVCQFKKSDLTPVAFDKGFPNNQNNDVRNNVDVVYKTQSFQVKLNSLILMVLKLWYEQHWWYLQVRRGLFSKHTFKKYGIGNLEKKYYTDASSDKLFPHWLLR